MGVLSMMMLRRHCLPVIYVLILSIALGFSVAQSVRNSQNINADKGVPVHLFNQSQRVLLCESAHTCSTFLEQDSTFTQETTYQNDHGACGCDELCSFFDDCCFDFNTSCALTNPNRLSFLRSLEERHVVRTYITCVTPNRNVRQANGFWMISKCPQTTQDTTKSSKCQGYNSSDFYEQIPVTDNLGLTYKNVYCAICHGVSSGDLIYWNFMAHCEERVVSTLEDNLATDVKTSQVIQYLYEKCSISYEPPGHAGPLGNRSCFGATDVSKCVQGVPENTLEACRKYSAYILAPDEDESQRLEGHRNPHCFMCSHGDGYDRISCEFDIPIVATTDKGFHFPNIIPISAIVNFNPSGAISVTVDNIVVRQEEVRCSEGAVYDPFSDKCRFLSCPVGSQLFLDICVPSAASVGCAIDNLQYGMVVTVNSSTYDYYKDKKMFQSGVKSCLTKLFNLDIIEDSPIVEIQSNLSWSGDVDDFREKNAVQFHFLIKTNVSSILDLQLLLDTVLLPGNQDTLSAKICGIIEATISQTCIETANCSNAIQSRYTFVTLNKIPYVFANATNVVYNILQPQLYISYKKQDIDCMNFQKFKIAQVCEHPLDCLLVTLSASEFQSSNQSTGALLHVPSGMQFKSYEYQMTIEGNIQVCSFFDTNGINNFTEVISFVAYSKPQVIVTLVGYITSIIAECITFATYCMFRSLRNRTSYSIMNLVIALFVGQLLLLVGGGRTDPQELCTAVAILLHYFFLATFAWSTVLSYDLHQIFGMQGVINARLDGRHKLLMLHMTYAWCSPLLVIIPCVVIHLCQCTELPFRYGNNMSCWINNEFANLLVFGVPLLVSFLFNIYHFFRTVWGIHVSKRDSSRTTSETARKKKYQELMIYAKIASLMGFTWIFAFIAAFTGMEAFWYIYIVMNSFQGLYVFLSFTANSVVWGLWKTKLPRKWFKGHTEATHPNTSNNRNRSSGVRGSASACIGNIESPAIVDESNSRQLREAEVASNTQV